MSEKVDQHKEARPSRRPLSPDLGGRATVAATGGFYDKTVPSEARRLDMMAAIGDPVSVAALSRLAEGDLSGRTVLDLGAGDSTTLGRTLVSGGTAYVPVDKRSGAIEVHSIHFPHAFVGDVADFSEVDVTPDYIHARFVAAWLPPGRREAMLAAMLERSDSGVIIDYDWSTARGPQPYEDAVKLATGVMRRLGFDPNYGKKSAGDITGMLSGLVDTSIASISVESTRSQTIQDGRLEDAYPVIEATATAIRDSLTGLGMYELVGEIDRAIDQLRTYTNSHPEEPVTLPDIVATEFKIDNLQSGINRSEVDFYGMLRTSNEKIANDSILPIVVRRNGDMAGLAADSTSRDIARRIQAATYYFDGIIGKDGIDRVNGVLISGIDPEDYVERSDYIVSKSADGRVTAVIRMIKSNGNTKNLPTVMRLQEHSPLAYNFLAERGVIDSEDVIEISGLAKNFYHGEHDSVIDAILALGEYAKNEGAQHAVMGLQDKHVPSLQAMLGPSVLEVIPTEDASHVIKLPDVSESIKFTAIYVDVQKFVERVYKHAQNNPKSVLAKRILT